MSKKKTVIEYDKGKLHTTTLNIDQLIDRHVGVEGTPERDQFNKEVAQEQVEAEMQIQVDYCADRFLL